jgi:hypothetical protein
MYKLYYFPSFLSFFFCYIILLIFFLKCAKTKKNSPNFLGHMLQWVDPDKGNEWKKESSINEHMWMIKP